MVIFTIFESLGVYLGAFGDERPLIYANSPQAKSRVDRANGVLRDRIKKLSLKVSTIEYLLEGTI